MTDRETMQRIMQILGPSAVCQCAGCQWETNEVLRLLTDAGIVYQHGSRLRKPAHDPAREREGNAIVAFDPHTCAVCGECACGHTTTDHTFVPETFSRRYGDILKS